MPSFLPDEEGVVRNNDFFGGNLEGIIGKLPYLKAQGVTCLYLSPIFEAGSNHKYDTGDYMRVDPGFGDEALLRELCKKAKSQGMRVVLDGVFSHVGIDSVYFNQYGRYDSIGAYQSKDSPYYPWFMFKEWPDEYECWWDILLLPAIDKREPSYQKYIAGEGGVVEHWQGCGVGGWRLDVVDELPDAFLDPLCNGIRRHNPDTLIIGEVWEDASNKIAYGARRRYFLGGQLDSVMNYPLKDAIIAFIRDGKVEMLADTMAALVQNYPKPVLDALMNVLGTHDTMRILTVLGGGRFPDTKKEMAVYRLTGEQLAHGKQMLKIASALQFTLPGFPCVYYGDEAGMEGGADPFNRVGYPWGAEDQDLVGWYRLLASIRGSQKAFREGVYRLAAAREGVFAFTRGEGGEAVFVAVNLGEEEYAFPLEDFRYDLIGKKTAGACAVSGKSVAIYAKGRQK
jgi:glycosidase